MTTTENPQPISTPPRQRFRGRLAWNMLATLLPLTIIPIIFMGWLTYSRARTLLLSQVSERIDIFIGQAIGHFDSWLLDKNLALDSITRSEEFITSVQTLTTTNVNSSRFQDVRDDTIALLRDLNPVGREPIYNHFLVVNPTGEILISTNHTWEGLSMAGEDYFEESILDAEKGSYLVVSPNPLYPAVEDTPEETTLITAYKIYGIDGGVLGFVVGVSGKSPIQEILETDHFFLRENKIFLITGNQEYVGITDWKKYNSLAPIQPSTGQINLVGNGPQENALVTSYTSYDGVEVLGIYKYYSTLNLGVIVEVPQETVLGGIESLTPFSILILSATSIAIALLIFLGARRFASPLQQLATTAQQFAQGNWEQRTIVKRKDEIGLLADTFNQMAEELGSMYQSMEFAVDERTRQAITAAEVASLATSSPSLEDLLNQSVELISERFGFYHAAIFLMDEARENATLRAATGTIGQSLKAQEFRIPIDTNSIVTWVAKNNKPHISADVDQDFVHLKHELLEKTRSEVGVPISISNEVLGILDVQSEKSNAFNPGNVEMLSTLANQLASAIQNFRLLEGTEIDLQQINELYRASRQIAKANTDEEILHAATRAVQQTTFIGGIYIPRDSGLELVRTPDHIISYAERLPQNLNVTPAQVLSYVSGNTPIIIRDVNQPATAIHSELLIIPQRLGCQTAAYLPIMQDEKLAGLIIIATRERGLITQTSLQPFSALIELVTTALEKVTAIEITQQSLQELEIINEFNTRIGNETDLNKLYSLIHEEVQSIIGDVDFFIALYDSASAHIEIPYLYEGQKPLKVDPFPLGEGLTSVIVRTRQPLMLVENTEERARALGAKVVGEPAKSWLGVPLIVGGEIVGIISVQDIEQEHRFSEEDLVILSTLASPIAGAIHVARLLEETQKRVFQLQTTAEIARDTSATLDLDTLLKRAVNLVRERFDFYHASVFLIDNSNEYAVVKESTGEAGQKMIQEEHKLAIGSTSIIGYVTGNEEPLVVNDVTQDPTHRFNPLLPDTRAELGIPIILGDTILGALDVQSTIPYAFSPDDVEILQILADLLAISITNAKLFTESQEHLAQHRLIHHVTSVAASSSGIEDSLSSAVQGLRVTLGDKVAILLLDQPSNTLNVAASSGYDEDIIGMQIKVGEGITGWVAEHQEPLLIGDVHKDPRYIAGKESVRSELGVPLIYRGKLLGVLNVESDELNAFSEQDQDILGTLAGSLSSIIVNAKLTERQRQLFEITEKIHRSVDMERILETTASELNKVLRTRRTRIQVGGETAVPVPPLPPGGNGPENEQSEEGDE